MTNKHKTLLSGDHQIWQSYCGTTHKSEQAQNYALAEKMQASGTSEHQESGSRMVNQIL
jgi:hypothetical protein